MPSALMRMRTRKFIGACLLLLLIAVWCFVAMALAPLLLASAGTLMEIAYYALAGIGWVLPAMPLVRWMARPDPA
jgi:hypothetical protein